jgi:hypothetical protein
MEIKTTRKCKVCKNLIVLETDKFVPHNKDDYYHQDCFIEMMKDKNLSQDEISEIIKKDREKNHDKIKMLIDKNHLFVFVVKKYELTFKPKYLFLRFEQIFNGSYKNITEPVSPSDLLDMWLRKENELDRINQWKIGKGEPLDGLNRLWYDVAILLSKAASYKKWKMSQVINDRTKENIIEENKSKIDYMKIYNGNKERTNIENILEEI